MSQTTPDGDFERNLRQHLEYSVDDIDDLTLARLRAARARAVESSGRPLLNKWWLPAGGFATAVVIVIALTVYLQNGSALAPVLDSGDMEMLSSVDSFEILDNLEFYQWLEAQEDATG
jgi:hypothetical protein